MGASSRNHIQGPTEELAPMGRSYGRIVLRRIGRVKSARLQSSLH
jgi:hypothetical protein